MKFAFRVTFWKVFVVCCFLVLVPSLVALHFLKDVRRGFSVEDHQPFKRSVMSEKSIIDNSETHLNVFVQVSDVHISYHQDASRTSEFTELLDQLYNLIKPQLVAITGDLTEGKAKQFFSFPSSYQVKSEWQSYFAAIQKLQSSGVPVLDMRGNHDAFRVPSLQSGNNLYRRYSVMGKNNSRSYHYRHVTPGGEIISFIAVDACPDPGPSRPFNFFGILNDGEMETLTELWLRAKEADFTVWLGHYPSSIIISPSAKFQELIWNGAVYLCGHLHTLASSMYTRHSAGNLELELADWKINRRYRIFALDHGLFSFTDAKFDSWPVILITNPKDCHFNMPPFEPLHKLRESSHIRVLVFSKNKIRNVTVFIDDQNIGSAHYEGNNLYTLPWSPMLYSKGVHTVKIMAETAAGETFTKRQEFCLDSTLLGAGGSVSAYILKFDHATFVMVIYILSVLLHLSVLVIFRFVDLHVEGSMIQCRSSYCYNKWFRRLRALSKSNAHFFFFIGFLAYICLGPWFFGEIAPTRYGAMFVYGIAFRNAFLPGSLTFLYGLGLIWSYVFPLYLYMAYLTDQNTPKDKRKHSNRGPLVCSMLMLLFVLLPSFGMVYEKVVAYGRLAFLLNVVRVWSVVPAVLLSYKAFMLQATE